MTKRTYEDVPITGFAPLKRTKAPEVQRPPKTVAWAWCPGCRYSSHSATGLIRQGEHLIWRLHSKPTFNGRRVDCPAGGARLCDVVPVDKADGRRSQCSCRKDP